MRRNIQPTTLDLDAVYTRCPQCATTFRITSAQLKARDGQVRCGRCQTVFQAREHLVERPAPAAKTGGTGRKRTHRKSAKAAAASHYDVDAPAAVATTAGGSVSGTRTGTEALKPAIRWADTTEAALLRPPRAGRHALYWGTGSLLLLLALASQALVFYGAQIARRMPALKTTIEMACEALPCRHTLVIDMQRLDLVETLVSPHPRYDRALRIKATIVNRADYVQPYPLLEVTLINSQGQVIARRAYKPREYLSKTQRRSEGLLPQVAANVQLDITSPGTEASGYEILLLPPSD